MEPPRGASSHGEIRRPCDPSVGGRGAMAQPKTTLYVGASARAPPEPARGSPIAIDRTTRRGDPTGRSLLPPSPPSSASRRSPHHHPKGDPSLQVQAVQESQHGNVFTDTSSSRSILPGVLEWAVAEIGAEKILFGTDTPLYHTAMQRIRVDKADLPQPQKERILRENALELWSEELFERNASC